MKILPFFALAAMLAACSSKDAQYDASGVFETTEVIVSAKAQGEIVRFSVDEGQDVKAGQPLGNIDMTQLELKKAQLASSLSANNSRRLNAEKQVASVEQQIANLQRERQRFEALLADGAATQKQVDDIVYQISTLQKQKDALTEQILTNNQSLDGQSGSISAQIGQVDDQLRNALISSPIDGVVLAKYAEQGEFAVPGRALFKVANLAEMKLRVYVTADQLTQIRIGQPVTVFADQGTSGRKEYAGTVSWISDKAEFTPKTIQTRDERANLVYAVKVNVSNDGLIKRGMYGDVKF